VSRPADDAALYDFVVALKLLDNTRSKGGSEINYKFIKFLSE
jgi:hypothetical protein